jgi:hypothetical protein
MAYQPNPNDPYRADLSDDKFGRQVRLDNDLQVDPDLPEGPASGSKVAMFALAIAVVLGAAFYGLNGSSINQAGTSTAQNTPRVSPPVAPPGMRDVTPRANGEPGVTTGAAPAQPAQSPATAPTSPDMSRSGNSSMDNAPASK